jgi:UPF0755 protein
MDSNSDKGLSDISYSYYFGIILVLVFLFCASLGAPSNFPVGEIVNIEEGAALGSVSQMFKEKDIVNSKIIFEALIIIHGGEKHVLHGDYLFDKREPVYVVAKRILRGDKRLAPVKVTIPEGYTVLEIKDAFLPKLKNFDGAKFLQIAGPEEGYLFPDTYFFFTTDTEKEVFQSLAKNYEKKISPIRPKIIALGKTEKEIIIMASIIEKEAKGDLDREIISGILWKRLKIGMALQVDAAPETYKVKGLPKNPISNPGLEAISAAMYPKASNYTYYLHDKDGQVYFAKTFAEHQANIKKYLK